jgi:hypothetical protein
MSAQADIILTAEGTRAIALRHAVAANITIFPAMNGIPAVGTGGTITEMNGIVRRPMPALPAHACPESRRETDHNSP